MIVVEMLKLCQVQTSYYLSFSIAYIAQLLQRNSIFDECLFNSK
jgi:hypothetical protein